MPSATMNKTRGAEDSFYRATTIRSADIDEERRTVRVSFSSETPVMRWFGKEVLLHGTNNVDLRRLRDVGAALMNHDPDRIVGPVSDVSLGEDGRGYAVIGFDDDEIGEKAFTKVKSRSLRGVSVRYLVEKAERIREGDEYTNEERGLNIKGPALIATRWQALEISLTPVPADWNVGVGRDATRSLDGIEFEARELPSEKITPSKTPNESEDVMNEKIRKYLESRGLDPKATEEEALNFVGTIQAEDEQRAADAKTAEESAAQSAARAEEVAKASALKDVSDMAAAAGQCDLALRMIADGNSADEIRAAITAAADKARGEPAGQPPDESKAGLDAVSDDAIARGLTHPQMVF